jgi:membrane-bound serine protease (ClpP class)
MFRGVWKSLMTSFLVAFFALFLCQSSISAERTPLKFAKSAEDIIYYVPQFSDFEEVSIHEMHFLKGILKEAKENNVKVVIFELDTPGGRIDVALKYVSILSKSEVPTIAFVNPHGISAGMIIALAANRIAINPDGTIGDAMPLQVTQQGVRPITDKSDEASSEKREKDLKDKKENKEIKKSEKEKKEPSKKEDTEKKKEVAEKKEKKKPAENNSLKRILKEFQKLKKQQKQSPEDKKLADQKFLTVYFKVLQVLAEKNNRPVKVIRAMADPYQKLSEKEDGIKHTKISPLTLSAVEAKKLNIVDYICRTKSDLRDKIGLSDCKIIIKNKTPTHQVIFFLAHPFISGVLIILGVIGLYIEAKTPGFGFAGGLGIAALALFFVGHVGIGDSNWVPALIFIIGVILLALEIFVVPGFGITGISGIIAIFASLLLAFGWDNLELAVNTVGISMIVATIIILILTIYILPKSTVFKKITLNTSHSNEDGFSSHAEPDEDLIGRKGIVHTTLRPTGLAIIDDKRLDVMTEGDFIEKGEKIKIIRINGMQIVVEKA